MAIYAESIPFLKKALQYAWMLDLTDIEIEIYDYLAYAYYYLG